MQLARRVARALILALFGYLCHNDAQAQLLLSANDIKVQGYDFPDADVVCKLTFRNIEKDAQWQPRGRKCTATCDVITTLKGSIERRQYLLVEYYVEANGRHQPARCEIKPGETYLALLKTAEEPYLMYAAMRGVPQSVEPVFGKTTIDLLLAELVAMSKSDDHTVAWEALEHIGFLRDRRASDVVAGFAKGDDDKLARQAMIAQYQMRIAPDVNRLTELLDPNILNAWCQESGTPQRDSRGEKNVWRTQKFDNRTIKFWQRGLPDFDYATFLREGIKQEWVRNDVHAPGFILSVIWQVQRPACVPELVNLLDDPRQRIRWWAIESLNHTVNGETQDPQWEDFQANPKVETRCLQEWKTWWAEKGQAYLAEAARCEAVLTSIRNIPELEGLHLRMMEHEFKSLIERMEFKSISIRRNVDESTYQVRTKAGHSVKVTFHSGLCSGVELIQPEAMQ